MELMLFWSLYFFIPLALQLLILRLTRNRLKVFRWILLSVVLFLLFDAWRSHHFSNAFFAELAVFVDLVLAGTVLLGWGIAWGVYALCKWYKHRKEAGRETDPTV